jgi:hypothetical protein
MFHGSRALSVKCVNQAVVVGSSRPFRYMTVESRRGTDALAGRG